MPWFNPNPNLLLLRGYLQFAHLLCIVWSQINVSIDTLISRREWVELVSENCLRLNILLKVEDAAVCLHQAMKALTSKRQ